MANDLAKRFIKKDGSQRISFYRDEYADNPRDNTDEPLHCEDWSSDYSIMNKQERENKASDARACIERLAGEFGDYKKIIDFLVENGKHMTDGKSVCNNALVYDKSLHGWALMEYTKWYGKKEYDWQDATFFDEKKYDIDLYALLDTVLDGTIDYIAENCMTDKVKVMSYGFGYNGEISFYREFSTDSEGICWLEKDEFLKYSGNGEDYWKDNDCYDIAKWLIEELEAYGNGEVYGFVVEDAVKYKTTRKCLSGNAEDEEYEETEWDEKGLNSCWGFYGELDNVEDDMFVNAGLNKEEFEEE